VEQIIEYKIPKYNVIIKDVSGKKL